MPARSPEPMRTTVERQSGTTRGNANKHRRTTRHDLPDTGSFRARLSGRTVPLLFLGVPWNGTTLDAPVRARNPHVTQKSKTLTAADAMVGGAGIARSRPSRFLFEEVHQ